MGASDDEDDDEGDYSGYLHPSLLAAKAKSSAGRSSSPADMAAASTVPQYTPSQLENTAYGKLLKKLSDNLPSVTNSPQRNGTPTHR